MLLLYTPLELLHLDFINIHDNKLWQCVFLQLLGLNFKETVTCHGHDDVLSVLLVCKPTITYANSTIKKIISLHFCVY